MTTTATLPWAYALTPVQLAAAFDQLAAAWREKTGHLSDTRRMAMLPEYQRIIGLGPAVLPLIFGELQREPSHGWFWALQALTGENPVAEADSGYLDRATAAWLAWGRQHGLIL